MDGVHGMAFRVEPLRDDADLERDGYVFRPGLLDANLVGALAAKMTAECESRGLAPGIDPLANDDPGFVDLQCALLSSDEFAAVGDAAPLLDLLRDLFGGEVRTRRGDLCRIAVPGHSDRATPPHQDHFYVGGSTSIVTVWIPLVDCPVELGPLMVLPGSHRGGVRRHDAERGVSTTGDETWAGGAMAVGDVLAFSALTVHRAAPNLTADRLRLSVDFRYEPAT
jgi:hypothetical protein